MKLDSQVTPPKQIPDGSNILHGSEKNQSVPYCKNNFGVGRALKTAQSLKGKYLTIKNLKFSISKNPKPNRTTIREERFQRKWKIRAGISQRKHRGQNTRVPTSCLRNGNEDTDLARRRSSGRRPGARSRSGRAGGRQQRKPKRRASEPPFR